MGCDDQYDVGNFIVGTTKATGEYASKNRARFAGVGGSAVS